MSLFKILVDGQNMKNFSLHVLSLLLAATGLGGFAQPTHAQCIQCEQAIVPMWQIYGINPFHPQTVGSPQGLPQHFSPLQANLYSQPYSNMKELHLALPLIQPNSTPFQGTVIWPAIEATPMVPLAPATEFMIAPNASGSDVSEIDLVDLRDSAPSPSDIAVVPSNPDSPTMVTAAGGATVDSASTARLQAADAELHALQNKIDESQSIIDVATQRAELAEQKVNSAKESFNRKMADMKQQASDKDARLSAQQAGIAKSQVEIQALRQKLNFMTVEDNHNLNKVAVEQAKLEVMAKNLADAN
ncbi:MAG: hypothetical protein ACI814_002912, partial [Mariniblastus sp.]